MTRVVNGVGEARQFSFGGKLEVVSSEFQLGGQAAGAGPLFSCRHIGSCSVSISDSRFDGLVDGQQLLDLCAGEVVLHRVTLTGATGGGLLGCTAADAPALSMVDAGPGAEEGGHRPLERWRTDSRCGTKYPAPGSVVGECRPWHDPCCSAGGWCGSSIGHCDCPQCKDYSASAGDAEHTGGGWASFGESRAAKVEVWAAKIHWWHLLPSLSLNTKVGG